MDSVDRSSFDLYKSVGAVAYLEELIGEQLEDKDITFDSHVGIAHTRWATHGEPCVKNCHPHASDDKREFVLIHNGIITNYEAIRDTLAEFGYVQKTDTDTEIIAILAKYLYDTNEDLSFQELMRMVLSELEGAFALIIKSIHYPGELVAAKKGSPLVLGLKTNVEEEGGGYEPITVLELDTNKKKLTTGKVYPSHLEEIRELTPSRSKKT